MRWRKDNPRSVRILTWNVRVGNPRTRVENALRAMAEKYEPHLIVTQECYHVRPRIPGYTRFQLPRKPDAAKDTLVSEDADTIVFIRNDVEFRRHCYVRMHTTWRGPKAGKRHAPRVFQTFEIKVDGRWIKASAGHWVFPSPGELDAVAEHVAWWRRWSRGFRRAFHVGDTNQGQAAMHSRGLASAGDGPDRAILHRIPHRRVEVLENEHGSDHHPVVIDLAW